MPYVESKEVTDHQAILISVSKDLWLLRVRLDSCEFNLSVLLFCSELAELDFPNMNSLEMQGPWNALQTRRPPP